MNVLNRNPRFAWCVLVAIVWLHSPIQKADAQILRGTIYPGAEYDIVFRAFYQGEYRDALRGFNDAARSGIRGVNFVWVDGVCYHTMAAECLYHVGDVAAALDRYNDAIRIYLANATWVGQIDFRADQVRPGIPERITWGPKGRKTVSGRFPESANIVQSAFEKVTIRQGDKSQEGISQRRKIYLLRLTEVLRCTGLAIARRNEILGPAIQRDSLSSQIERRLVSQVSTVPANHWSRPMFSVCLGLAQMGTGKKDEGVGRLQSSLTYGQLDHPLTSLALLQIGRNALESDQLDVAATSFYEATFPAADYQQLDVVEESAQYAAEVHRIRNPTQPFPFLDQILTWARANRYARVSSSVAISSAYLAYLRMNPQQATQYLKDAQRSMARTNLLSGNLGARYHFANAATLFFAGREREANIALSACLKMQSGSSNELFRIAWTLAQARSNAISESTASQLFRRVLARPTSNDWRRSPLATMTLKESSLSVPLSYWMDVELNRDQIGQVVEIADRIRARKFTGQRPLLGRLMNLRWLLECPEILLDNRAQVLRKELLNTIPEWSELSKQVRDAQRELEQLPTLPTEKDDIDKMQQLAKAIHIASERQEKLLTKIALRQEGTPDLFPPLRSLDQIQSNLRPGQAVLDVIWTSGRAIFILLTSENQYDVLSTRPANRDQRMIVTTLKAYGNTDRNKPVLASHLSGRQWEKAATEVYQAVFAKIRPDQWNGIRELIVVPDGPYWYVPFETLIDGTDGLNTPLISRCQFRYVPLASLAGNDVRKPVSLPSSLIVAGRIYGSDNDPRVAELAQQLAQQDPRAAVTSKPLPVSTADAGSRWDRLIVMHDIERSEKEPFGWKPAQADGKHANSKLSDWMELPWESPSLLILGGFNTAASGSVGNRSTGDEMFLSTMGLLSCGCRTVLLSRWRSGGQKSLDIIREFVLQLPDESPASAFQRSIELARSSPIDPELEPRIRSVNEENVPKSEHPFFWGAYQLIDLGQPLEVEESTVLR